MLQVTRYPTVNKKLVLPIQVAGLIDSDNPQMVRSSELDYTEAKVDVTQEIEQRAQQAAQAIADHCTLCSISCVTST